MSKEEFSKLTDDDVEELIGRAVVKRLSGVVTLLYAVIASVIVGTATVVGFVMETKNALQRNAEMNSRMEKILEDHDTRLRTTESTVQVHERILGRILNETK